MAPGAFFLVLKIFYLLFEYYQYLYFWVVQALAKAFRRRFFAYCTVMNATLQLSVGHRIAQARRKAGLTQVELAKRLGVTQQAITFWERQAPAPRAEMLSKLSEVLDISIDELLGIAPRPNTSGKKGPASRFEKLVDALAVQPRKRQERILDVLETMLRD